MGLLIRSLGGLDSEKKSLNNLFNCCFSCTWKEFFIENTFHKTPIILPTFRNTIESNSLELLIHLHTSLFPLFLPLRDNCTVLYTVQYCTVQCTAHSSFCHTFSYFFDDQEIGLPAISRSFVRHRVIVPHPKGIWSHDFWDYICQLKRTVSWENY